MTNRFISERNRERARDRDNINQRETERNRERENVTVRETVQ